MILTKYSKIGKEIGEIDDSANIGGGYGLSNISQLYVYTYQEFNDFKTESQENADVE